MAQTRSNEDIAEAFNRLQLAKTKGKSMASQKAYFVGILNNIANPAGDTRVEQAEVEAKAERPAAGCRAS